jgi:hypothetical protein
MREQLSPTTGTLLNVLFEDRVRDIAELAVNISGNQIFLTDFLLDPGH